MASAYDLPGVKPLPKDSPINKIIPDKYKQQQPTTPNMSKGSGRSSRGSSSSSSSSSSSVPIQQEQQVQITLPTKSSYSNTKSTIQNLTLQDFQRNAAESERVNRISGAIANTIINPAYPFEEGSRKQSEENLGYAGIETKKSYNDKNFNRQLPEITRGSSGTSSTMLSYEQLGQVNYGGGSKAAGEQAQLKADIQSLVYVDAKSRNNLDFAQTLYDSKLISYDQANSYLKQQNELLKQDVKKIYEDEFKLAQTEFTKGRESVKYGEAFTSAAIATLPFAGAGFISGTRGTIGFIQKTAGVGFLGSELYTSTKDLITGNFKDFPSKAISLAVGGLSYYGGYKAGYKGFYEPNAKRALETAQLSVTSTGKGFDISLSKYGFDEKGMLEINKLLDKGYYATEVELGLVPSSPKLAKYLPEVKGVGLALTDTVNPLSKTNVIGRISSKVNNKIIEKDFVADIRGITQGDLTESITALRLGKFGNTNIDKVLQIESIDTQLVTERGRQNILKIDEEGVFRTDITYSGKVKDLPFSDKTTIDSIQQDLNKLKSSKKIETTEGEFYNTEDITGVTFSKKGFTGLDIDSGGLLGSGRTKELKSSSITINKEIKRGRFRTLPLEESMPKVKGDTLSMSDKQIIKDSELSESSLLVGMKTDLLSQHLFGHGYGVNYGGGFKVALREVGLDSITNIKPRYTITTDFNSKEKEITNIKIKDFITIKDNSLIRNEELTSNKFIEMSNAVVSTREGLGLSDRQLLNQGQDQLQIQEQDMGLKLDQVITNVFKPIQVPRTPRPIIPPPMIDIDIEDRKKSKRITSRNPAYRLLVKRKGRFSPVASGLTRGRALQLGENIVSNELSRQFKLVQSGTTSDIDVGYDPSENIFRKFKVRRGKRIYEPDTFIQRTSANLKSISEKALLRASRIS